MPEEIRKSRLEGGLSSRQKEFIAKELENFVASALHGEAMEDNGILSYDAMYDLTQTAKFIEWQEEVLSRPTDATHPGESISKLIVQLEKSDAVLSALVGYIGIIRRQLWFAQDNVKAVMNTVFHSYDGDLGIIQVEDKDGQRWQIFTAAAAPDSVVLRRAKMSRKSIRTEGSPGSQRK